MIKGIEQGSQMSTAAYIRWEARSRKAAYEERWGSELAFTKPSRTMRVSAREIAGTEWAADRDGIMRRIAAVPH